MSAAHIDPLHETVAAAAPSRPVDPALAEMARQSYRLTLGRLAAEVLDAVADGDSGVPETGRLHTWVRVEFLPWIEEQHLDVEGEADRAALRSDIGVIVGLNSLLAGASRDDAAMWTGQLQRTALILLTRLDYLAPS